jgi:hypothetical protein
MKLNEDNFLVFAMHHYDNQQCHSLQEFEEDLKRFLYLRKLLNRYKRDGDLKERLILNHVIILYNLFGDAVTDMLFLKIDKEYWSALVTFLVYLNRIPEEKLSDIPLDQNIISALRKI